MQRHSFIASLVLAALSFVVFAGAVVAGEQVPLKGVLQGDVTRSGAPPVVSVNITGGGTASHLGKFTVSIPHTVNVITRTATGSYVFTAANGDTLTADFTGQSTPTSDPTVLLIVESATITGGTGQLANASGSFTVERLYDTVAGSTEGTFEGTISSVGASKQ